MGTEAHAAHRMGRHAQAGKRRALSNPRKEKRGRKGDAALPTVNEEHRHQHRQDLQAARLKAQVQQFCSLSEPIVTSEPAINAYSRRTSSGHK